MVIFTSRSVAGSSQLDMNGAAQSGGDREVLLATFNVRSLCSTALISCLTEDDHMQYLGTAEHLAWVQKAPEELQRLCWPCLAAGEVFERHLNPKPNPTPKPNANPGPDLDPNPMWRSSNPPLSTPS